MVAAIYNGIFLNQTDQTKPCWFKYRERPIADTSVFLISTKSKANPHFRGIFLKT